MQLCLIIDVAGVFGTRQADPAAAAMLGELRRLEATLQAQPGTARLAITLIRVGAAPSAFADIAAATGDPGTVIAAAPDVPAMQLCPDHADRIILLTDQGGVGLDDARIWRIGDAVGGVATLADVARRVSETMQLAIPRPVDPGRLRGALVALPAAASAPHLLAAAYHDPGVDWMTIGRQTILFVPDPQQAAALARLPEARVLGDGHARRALVVAPAGADALVADAGMAVFRVTEGDPPKGALPWIAARRRTWP